MANSRPVESLEEILARISRERLPSNASQYFRRAFEDYPSEKSSDDDTVDVLAKVFSRSRIQPEEYPTPVAKTYSDRYHKLQEERRNLPVWKDKHTFLKLLKQNKVVLVQGETGCGKTSQIPQWCLEYVESKQNVVCTQPRRMAASSIAKRVAAEMDVQVGEEVGYSIRFDDCTSLKTILTFMTEGILMRKIASSPLLHEYGVILMDECHERGTFVDVLMGHLQKVVEERDDLRLVIMSASLNKQEFKRYFVGAPLLEIPHRLYPIEIIHENKDQFKSVEAAVEKVKKIHREEKRSGDILVFMTGKAEIDQTCQSLELWADSLSYADGSLLILPLYGSLPVEDQDLVFQPTPQNYGPRISRKVIIATNIAETSVTINGIVFVIDCGYMNQKKYNQTTRAELIKKERITQTNADQRAGRAGRTQPGKCYRLYTRQTYLKMEPYVLPEIKRSNLSSMVLDMKHMGISDVITFNFMDSPGWGPLSAAITDLQKMQALDRDCDITELGMYMAQFPVDPMVAKMIISSCDHKCSEDILTIAAMLSVDWCFISNRKRQAAIKLAHQKFVSPKGDHIMLLKLYKAFKASGECKDWSRTNYVHHRHLQSAVNVRSQLKAILHTVTQKRNLNWAPTEPNDLEYTNVRKAILSGFSLQIAEKRGQFYRTAYDPLTDVELDNKTGLTGRPEHVVYHERLTFKQNYISIVTPVEIEWYKEVLRQST